MDISDPQKMSPRPFAAMRFLYHPTAVFVSQDQGLVILSIGHSLALRVEFHIFFQMAAVELPPAATEMLAASQMRDHHRTWHFVRARWHTLTTAERNSFVSAGWKPPRLNPIRRPGEPAAPPSDPGAGLDFFCMHRRMIEDLNSLLTELQNVTYPRVIGWAPIPWNHSDHDWPMPPNYHPQLSWAKDPEETARWRSQVSTKLENSVWLAQTNLDRLGLVIEDGIHNWLHMHWAAAPWFTDPKTQDENDPRNDYLGDTYSSHVNKAFWKLHGWIDDRIGQWETVTGKAADFSNSWSGPQQHHHLQPLDVGAQRSRKSLLTDAQKAESRNFFANRA